MEFSEALDRRMQDLAAACTQCGKCFEACPMTAPIGLSGADPKHVLSGVVGLLRGVDGNQAAQRWTAACSSSGLCRDACDYGVDARLLVRLANFANIRRRDRDAVRKNAIASFRGMAKTLRIVTRLQLDQQTLSLVQPQSPTVSSMAAPDVALYTGCNVAKTPHILLLCLEVLRTLGLSYELIGGPNACCGVNQFRAGDAETSGRAGLSALAQIEARKATTNVSWCPSCQAQFEDVILPNRRLITGRDNFSLVPFFIFLEQRLDRLRPFFKRSVNKRVALDERPGYPDVTRAVERIVSVIPGVELVHLHVPRAGLMSNYLTVTPRFKEQLRIEEFRAAARAGVTTLATIFHACHRELCRFEKETAFEIINVMEIIGESMGFHADDVYKKLALAKSVEDMMQQCSPLLIEHGLDPEETREVLIADQLAATPLQGAFQEVDCSPSC